MSQSLKGFTTRSTPQSEPIPGSDQARNEAGGFTWQVDKWTRLNRFLILGTEGGTLYVGESKLTAEAATSVLDCIHEDGSRVVGEIATVSEDGRAAKNDQAIFALALASVHGDEATRKEAYDALSSVCRIGTHLFQFMNYREQFGGWGRGARRAVGRWYTDKAPDKLAYQLVKYRQREGWTHRDVLRVAHPNPADGNGNLLAWTTGKPDNSTNALPDMIRAYERAQNAESAVVTAALVSEYNLPREALNTEHLKHAAVWGSLLEQGMPMTALIRNLGTMTKIGVLTPTARAVPTVVNQIKDKEAIRKARIHPIAVLAAARTYAAGQGFRGSATWSPVPQIVDALSDAFYLAFGNVETTGKRYMLGLDVSGSMFSATVSGMPFLTAAEAAGTMSMVTASQGDPYEVVAFTAENSWFAGAGTAPDEVIPGLSALPLSPRQRLDDVMGAIAQRSRFMGNTDCALPMIYAAKARREVDCFVIYTDNQTWAGRIHPKQALDEYRRVMGIDARFITVAMTSEGPSIADPNDPGMIDVVGFDTNTPEIISGFAKGEI